MIARTEPADCPALVEAAMSGDRRAMSAIWQANRRWVAAVLLSHMPGSADLEDLLQETAMRLVANVHTLREPAHLRAWLRSIAVNVARSAARGRQEPAPIGEATEPAGEAPAIGADDEAQRIVGRVMSLPESYREPLLLRAVHGLRTRQIATILEIEPATVDTRIARARRMLQDLVVEGDGDAAAAPTGSGRPMVVGAPSPGFGSDDHAR